MGRFNQRRYDFACRIACALGWHAWNMTTYGVWACCNCGKVRQ